MPNDDPADAPKMKLHFLDMGKTMYGDSILARIGSRTILIDGGHKGDYKDHDGSPGIPTQLAELLGHERPFHVWLLVVTHCHSDHIGCLPRLVAEGTLTAEWALVADERLGFGSPIDGDNPLAAADVTPQMRKIVAALNEENLASVTSDAELAELIDAADALEPDYQQMLETLEEQGTKLFRYGRDDLAVLQAELAAVGVTIHGPADEHLFICAEAIRQHNSDALAELRGILGEEDAPADVAGLFRALAQSETDDPDLPGLGAAKNNQSIVLSLAAGGWKALLTGDMQFAKAEVGGLSPHMTALKDAVGAAGPYDLVKTAHHSSYNGVSDAVIDAFGAKTLVHTGGWNDPGHPSSSVLKILRRRRAELTWARTDKNGLITAQRTGGKIKLSVARGSLNNAAANRRDDTPALEEPPAALPALPEEPPLAPAEQQPLPAMVAAAAGDVPNVVEVIAKVPHTATRVVLTIDVQPGSAAAATALPTGTPAPQVDPRAPFRLGGGRQLPKLLFVTNRQRLAANIGQTEAGQALAAIRASGQMLLESVSADIRTAPREVNALLRSAAARGTAGVVLLGGYDVVPSQRFDALPPALRRRLANPASDHDQFVVWSDDVYGCIDADDLPELPVSRIADGKSPQLVFRALSAGGHLAATKFCARNFHRPFAAGVFAGVSGSGNLEVSERLAPQNLLQMPSALAADAVYIMLHGADFDATRFWGETAAADLYETMTLENVPRACRGVVFSGCCWGAMPVNRRASQASSSAQAGPRTPADSLALAFLAAGARAFVGCTGVHYSPTIAPYNYFGGPMHQAFWSNLVRTGQPARALFEAKKAYLRGIPHRRTGSAAAIVQNEAIELKIMRQYTCLGLGW